MSKLSVHISSGNRFGFGDWLTMSRPTVIYSVSENIKSDISKLSPSTKWIYRYQTDEFNRLPDGFFQGDPVANCRHWMTEIKDSQGRTLVQNWSLNNADWFDPLNESVPDLPAKAQWLNTWMLVALDIAASLGFKLALFSFATGSPPLEMWQYLVPAMQKAKTLGGILSLHSYWESDPSQDKDNALRYRQVYDILPESARLPIVISEASSGNGYGTSYSGQEWVNDMAAYDAELMKDPYVLSACGFQLGGNESNMLSALNAYAVYIESHPTPEVTMRGSPRTQYERTVNVYSASATKERVAAITVEAFLRGRETVTGSYDDAGIGDLDVRYVNLYDIPLIDQPRFADFYKTYYPGVLISFLPKA